MTRIFPRDCIACLVNRGYRTSADTLTMIPSKQFLRKTAIAQPIHLSFCRICRQIANSSSSARRRVDRSWETCWHHSWIGAVCLYLDRSRIKNCRNLRFRPQFYEVFDSGHLASRIGKSYSPCYQNGNILIYGFPPSS
ncbi:hypothetical protein K469DRAFT_211723 [Zopfia rhizophila CBS 207.26]|uniref:Uncharacterized protein n=1 Tax=Zopfia rhizophila CBS 207.26 TaxID=1314779 RepID=A0A6A6DYH0_9PEZI|nr:hypothetical protein K469DRAFT_211723 [Zopfia rhizophila CBS 207.26]